MIKKINVSVDIDLDVIDVEVAERLGESVKAISLIAMLKYQLEETRAIERLVEFCHTGK